MLQEAEAEGGGEGKKKKNKKDKKKNDKEDGSAARAPSSPVALLSRIPKRPPPCADFASIWSLEQPRSSCALLHSLKRCCRPQGEEEEVAAEEEEGSGKKKGKGKKKKEKNASSASEGEQARFCCSSPSPPFLRRSFPRPLSRD